MDELLGVLRGSLLFLLERSRYRIAGSQQLSPYGDAEIRLESPHLIWTLVCDRAQVLLSLRWADDASTEFSTDLLYQLVEDRVYPTGLLTAEMAAWLEENLDEIERRFRIEPEVTRVRLQKLKRERAKRIFGAMPRED